MDPEPHQHPIYKVSSLGRPVDPRFPSNKAILVVMALASVAAGVWGWADTGAWTEALGRGLQAGIAAFTAWALGRELDPDRPGTAMIAVAFTGLVFVWQGQVDYWTLGGGILVARLVGRSIGPGAKVTDLVMVLGFVGAAVLLAERWTLGISVGVALAFDALLPRGTRDRWAWASACVAIVVVHVGLRGAELGSVTWPIGTAVVTAISLLAIATLPAPQASCDQPGHPLEHRRVQASMLAVLLVAVLAQWEAAAGPLGLGVAACLLATVPGRFTPAARGS